ncbi:MAG TPA: GDP-mannose 4,6-dehydratase [bacterium]|nr:GDP-mannose 4,6-dehydratase [bacterium]HPJ71061.1 GDP-mannose 4,6-dehydratase [bacterium]HPQ65922.1 GDP-mannose 4,6-dehydratase [bacterium]
MPTALITGVAGFAGSHLAELLLQEGWRVAGTDRPGISRSNIEDFLPRMVLREFDLLDQTAMSRVIREFDPDCIFHLAAVAFIPYAQHYPALVFDINAKGFLHVASAAARKDRPRRLVLISSSQVYGELEPGTGPLTDSHALRPVNIYGLSKLCAEEIAAMYQRDASLDTVVVRPFNHFGPRQRSDFVVSDWARQIAQAEAGRRDPRIRVGNLDAARDFTDVRDMVKGYLAAAERGVSGATYNICSGRAYRVGDILEMLLKRARIPIEIVSDRDRLRVNEIPTVVGDYSPFRRDTGWAPALDLEAGLDDTLAYWRSRLARG